LESESKEKTLSDSLTKKKKKQKGAWGRRRFEGQRETSSGSVELLRGRGSPNLQKGIEGGMSRVEVMERHARRGLLGGDVKLDFERVWAEKTKEAEATQ